MDAPKSKWHLLEKFSWVTAWWFPIALVAPLLVVGVYDRRERKKMEAIIEQRQARQEEAVRVEWAKIHADLEEIHFLIDKGFPIVAKEKIETIVEDTKMPKVNNGNR